MINEPPYFEPPPPPRRSRWTVAVGVSIAVAVVVAVSVVVAHQRSNGAALPASQVPGLLPTPGDSSCADTSKARAVWTDVTHRLDALVLHPDVNRIDTVAQGNAAQDIRLYTQQTLLDKHLTEREAERLDDVAVLQAGCGGLPLTLRVTETLVQDDYLAADGHVDHTDPGVGHSHSSLETYIRYAGIWKLVDLQSLDAPTPTDSGQTI